MIINKQLMTENELKYYAQSIGCEVVKSDLGTCLTRNGMEIEMYWRTELASAA
jgi:hypothetical protein